MSPQYGGHLGTWGCAKQRGESNSHKRQHALQLLDNSRKELIREHAQDGGHQYDLEGAQGQTLRSSRAPLLRLPTGISKPAQSPALIPRGSPAAVIGCLHLIPAMYKAAACEGLSYFPG